MDNIENKDTSEFNQLDTVWKKIKYIIFYALNPIGILSESTFHRWYLYLILPAVGWMLFFLQVGLDKYYGFWKVLLMVIIGLISGYSFVGAIGFIMTFILSYLGKELKNDQVISLIALSHTYMASSMFLGLIYNIIGFNSSASFGIAGLMCTLLPIYAGIRTLSKRKPFMAPLLTTLVGVLLLMSWQLIIVIVS
jgi:hypothetical protein